MIRSFLDFFSKATFPFTVIWYSFISCQFSYRQLRFFRKKTPDFCFHIRTGKSNSMSFPIIIKISQKIYCNRKSSKKQNVFRHRYSFFEFLFIVFLNVEDNDFPEKVQLWTFWKIQLRSSSRKRIELFGIPNRFPY